MKRVTADKPGKHGNVSSPIAHMISLFKRHEYLVLLISCDPHRWKFIAAYLYDQAGSVLYYYSLGSTDLSIAVPIANGLTFAVAGITEAIVDKRLPTRATIEGSVLILIGVYVCFSSKQ